MSRTCRLACILGLVSIGTLATPRPAAAQYFRGGFGVNIPGLRFPLNPGFNFRYRWSAGISISSGLGPGVSFGYSVSGVVGLGLMQRYRYQPQSYLYAPSYSGFMTGGMRSPAAEAQARNFARAQQAAGSALRNSSLAARSSIHSQWNYEKFGASSSGSQSSGSDADALGKALNATEAEIISGKALNHIAAGIASAKKPPKKADSAFLAPNLLAQIQFTGSDAADAINMLRQAGKLAFPAPFEDAAFEGVRAAISKDFAASASPVLLGKSPDPARVRALQADIAKARAIFDPITKNFEFEEAIAARRFLNQMDAVVAALKGRGVTGLINPKWATEGTSVVDLVGYMGKNKLLFAPVAKGNEEAYGALYRGLGTYLFALNDNQKGAKKR